MKWQKLLLIFTLTSFNVSAFADGDDKPQVIIKDFKFIPQEITIKRGHTLKYNVFNKTRHLAGTSH